MCNQERAIIKMSNQEIGQGWWLNAESYSQIAGGLPTIKAMHVIISNFIREKLKAGPIKVLSLGIGSAAFYKSFFQNEIEENKLQLFGIDILENMIDTAQKNFPQAVLKVSNLLKFDQFFSEKFDVIEATLVLHHILRFDELSQLIKKVYSSLNPDSLFIIGDIDITCGEYIEEKLHKQEQKSGALSVDLVSGEFFNKSIRRPIFSLEDKEDLEVIQKLMLATCLPLLRELENLSLEEQEKLKPLVLKNIDSANKGLEWHRALNSPAGWQALIENSFVPCKDLIVVPSDTIKAGFSGVFDNPFVLAARK